MPLLLLSNRDESYDRAATPLHWWGRDKAVLAGQDRQAGGTWLGISRDGRLAALTNFRTGVPAPVATQSRGQLVTDFLEGSLSGADYLDQISKKTAHYNPFTLLVFDKKSLLGLESNNAHRVDLAPGVGALSNAGFNTPWPKLLRLKNHFEKALALDSRIPHIDVLRHLLHDTRLAPDDQLPDTGIPLDLERTLSAIFVTSPRYGTRASSVVAIHQNHAMFSEETYGPRGTGGRRSITFFYVKNN